jgi:uncharacterized surface protein with fasciclin (FAS1) repeats
MKHILLIFLSLALLNPVFGELTVAPWYPQGVDYVFICSPEAETYDWFFGDGDKLIGITESTVFHRYEPGTYTVTCISDGVEHNIEITVVEVPDERFIDVALEIERINEFTYEFTCQGPENFVVLRTFFCVDGLCDWVEGDRYIFEAEVPGAEHFLECTAEGYFDPGQYPTVWHVGRGTATLTVTLADNVMDELRRHPELSTFVMYIEQAGLDDILASGEYTVFAPTNNAFEILSGEQMTGFQTNLETSLMRHLIAGRHDFEQLDQQGIWNSEAETEINALRFWAGDIVNDATSVSSDLEAENGFIHIIDRVLTVEREVELSIAPWWPKDLVYVFDCQTETQVGRIWFLGDGAVNFHRGDRIYHEYGSPGEYLVSCVIRPTPEFRYIVDRMWIQAG